MRRLKLRKSTRQYITVAFISVVIVSGAALFAYMLSAKKLRETYEAKLEAVKQEMDGNRREVLVATQEITAGTRIGQNNTKSEIRFASQPQDTYITGSDLGKTALVDIPRETQITKAVVAKSDITSDLRESGYNTITISSQVRNGDTVDIRLLYPNGENYIVLAKKRIIKPKEEGKVQKEGKVQDNLDGGEENTASEEAVTGETECYFWLTEEEIDRMSGATVDAYLYEGAKLYTTEYVEPALQEASIVNYTPSLAVIDLIQKNPNIVETASEYLSNIVRKELENRLAQSMNTDIKEVEWDTQNNLTQSKEDTQAAAKGTGNYYYEQEKTEKEKDTEYGE